MSTSTFSLPVRGSTTGRPIMALLDLLGRRTALRVLWELRSQPLTFRDLQAAAETNPGLLNKRLTELREAAIVDITADGYTLTPEGNKLLTLLLPLSRWSESWAKRLNDGTTKRVARQMRSEAHGNRRPNRRRTPIGTSGAA
jgi:DNA-binding HxlR family transcriptional regulator